MQVTVVGFAGVLQTDLLMNTPGVDIKDDHIFEGSGYVSLSSLHQQ